MTVTKDFLPVKNKDEKLEHILVLINEAIKKDLLTKARNLAKIGLERAIEIDDAGLIFKFKSISSKIRASESQDKTPVKDLTAIKGIGNSVAKKLKEAGIHTITQLSNHTSNLLSNIKGIGGNSAKKMIKEAKKKIREEKLLSKNNLDEPYPQDPFDAPEEIEQEESFTSQVSVKKPSPKSVIGDFLAEPTEDLKIEELKIENPSTKISAPQEKYFEPETDDFLAEPTEELKIENPSTKISAPQEKYFEQETSIPSHDSLMFSIEQHRVDFKSEIKKKSGILLKKAGYFFIKSKSLLPGNLQDNIDFISLDVININNNLKCLVIVPVKIHNFKGNIAVSKNTIDYIPSNRKTVFSRSEKKIISNDGINKLIRAQELIFQDLTNEGEFFNFLKDYLKIKISTEKTLSRKSLFFRTGNLLYKLIISPVLLSLKAPAFLDSSLPFPYQKKSNIHFIGLNKFIDLLGFQKKKYFYIETYSKTKNNLEQYFDSVNSFVKQIRLSSVPFLIFGFVFLFVLMFQAELLGLLFLGIGTVATIFYSLLLFFLYYRFYLKKSSIKKDFITPYYQKQVKLGEKGLSLISEELNPKMLEQFTFECSEGDSKIHSVQTSKSSNNYSAFLEG